jgi:hypothetical protein
MKRSVILSHLMVLALGGAVAWILLPHRTGTATATNAAATLAKRKTTTADELLDRLTEKTRKESAAARNAYFSARIKSYTEAFEKLPDIGGKCQELFSQIKALGFLDETWFDHSSDQQLDTFHQLTAAVHVWLKKDPAAAIAALYSGDPVTAKFMRDSDAINGFAEVARTCGVSSYLEMLAGLDPRQTRGAYSVLCNVISKNGSLDDLRYFRQVAQQRGVPISDDGIIYSSASSAWPLEKRDELISSIPKEHQSNAIGNIIDGMPIQDGANWLQDLMEKGTLDEAQILSFRGKLEAKLYDNRDTTPFNEKVAILKIFPGCEDFDEARAAQYLAAQTVSSEVTHADEDYLYLCQKGEISAEDIMQQLLAKSANLGIARERLREELFTELIQVDLEQAESLLAGKSEKEQQALKLKALENDFSCINPEYFYQVISSLPDPKDPDAEKSMARLWKMNAGENLNLYGDTYLDWATTLPNATQRRMALEAVKKAARHDPLIKQKASALLEAN